MKRLFACFGSAYRNDTIQVTVGPILAVSEAEALTIMDAAARRQWPEADGWSDHYCGVTPVPEAVLKKAALALWMDSGGPPASVGRQIIGVLVRRERDRCIELARDWVPKDVLAALEAVSN